MIRIYILGMMVAMCVGAYFSGRAVGRAGAAAQCKIDVVTQQIQTVKHIGKINAETNHTAVRDIRRVLREKYTIAE